MPTWAWVITGFACAAGAAYLTVLGAVAYFGWRSRKQVSEMVSDVFEELRNW